MSQVFFEEEGVVFLGVLFFNEKNSSRLNGRLSYREKTIWTISYFQDSGNSTNLSGFLGRKPFSG